MPPEETRSRRVWHDTIARAAFASAVLLAALVLPVAGQQARQVPPQMSLEDAIELAHRHSPQYLRTTNDVEVARSNIRVEWFTLVPNVSLNASVNANYQETQTAFDEFGQPLEQPQAVIAKTSSASQSISLGGITLFDGGRTWRNIDIAELNTERARLGVASQANALRTQVTNAYFQVVNAEGRIELEQQLLDNARERLELIEQQFRIAAAKQTALLGAEVEVAAQEQQLAAARANVSRLRLDLLQVIGLVGIPEFQLTSGVPGVFDPAGLDAEALVERALARNPQILEAVTGLSVAEKSVANARSQRLPTLQLGLPSYSWSERRRGLFDAWGELGSPNRSFSLSLSASLPLFRGFQTTQQIQQSQADAQDQRYTLQQQRLETEASVRSGLIDLEQRYNDLLLAQRRAELTQTRLDLAQEEYRLGGATFTELQQIIEQNANSQRAVLDAQLQFLTTRVALEQSIGGPLNQ